MDETAVQLLPTWLYKYNSEFKDTVKLEEITDWDIHKCLKPEAKTRVYDILKIPGLFKRLPPMPGAVEAITELVECGHDVKFCSAPPSIESCSDKMSWVVEHFNHIGLGKKNLILLHEKHWLIGAADVLIDDKPATIEKWATLAKTEVHKPKIMTIATPYNTSVADIADVYAESWQDPEAAWKTITKAIHAHADYLSSAYQFDD